VRLPEFEFYEPGTLAEACDMMARYREEARPLAGGTDLVVNMKRKRIRPNRVVSLSKIDALKGMVRENGQVMIGACVTTAEIAGSETLEKGLVALSEGARVLGSPLIRNLATIAGNVVSARPAADLPPPLMAYGAKAMLANTAGERCVDLNDFFTGPGETVMAPDEILSKFVIEVPQGHCGGGYIKLGMRKTLEISLVNVAAVISLDTPDGPVTKARIVLGSVGPTPMRALSAENVLRGQFTSNALFTRAGEAASRESQPIDDFRGSAEYRRDMVSVLTKRVLNMALSRAMSG